MESKGHHDQPPAGVVARTQAIGGWGEVGESARSFPTAYAANAYCPKRGENPLKHTRFSADFFL